MESSKGLRVDGDRLWRHLMAMAVVGQTAKGGVCRVALTDEDKEGRDLFIEWSNAAGCTVSVDKMGNIFARRKGRQDELEPVLVGSHLDSQPTGGKFDGAYGVLAGLEVIETLNDAGITTERPLEIVSWTNEEGARFAPAMIGSGVFAGVFDLDYGLGRVDSDGHSLGEELRKIGYAGTASPGSRGFKAAFELHIEQGPILESSGMEIGTVTGVQGIRWYELVISGREAHAGPTPMHHRRDPVKGAAVILQGIYDLADRYSPDGRATIGDIKVEPGVINTVPGRLALKVDLRHPDETKLKGMDQDLIKLVKGACHSSGLKDDIHNIWYSPPVVFDADCIESVSKAAQSIGVKSMNIVSGAGHDAVYVSKVAPTSMIFIPCKDGLSHNELESVKKSDAIAGANVLLQALLDQSSS